MKTIITTGCLLAIYMMAAMASFAQDELPVNYRHKTVHKGTATKSRLIARVGYKAANLLWEADDSARYSYSGNRGGDLSSKRLPYDLQDEYGFDTDQNAFVHYGKGVQTFDQRGNNTSWLGQYWDDQNNAWVNSEGSFYFYDNNDSLTCYVSVQWDDVKKVWDSTYRKERTFANNKLSEELELFWVKSQSKWGNSSRVVFTYTAKGELETRAYSSWNLNTLSFDNINRGLYEYNNAGKQTKYKYQEYDKNTQQWKESQQTISVFSPSGLEQETQSQHWVSNNWRNLSHYLHSYTANGLLEITIHRSWDNNKLTWVDYAKTIYTYDGNGNIVQKDKMAADANKVWIDNLRDISTYNQHNQLTSVITTKFKNGNWQPEGFNGKRHYYYEDYTPDNPSTVNGLAALDAEITLFPNPASDYITVKASFKHSTAARITIMNMAGMKLVETSYDAVDVINDQVNISMLPAGMYQCVISTKDGARAEKISIAR